MATEVDNNDGQPGAAEPRPAPVGLQLRKARKRQGFSEKQVADRLHITMHYVRALETDSYDKLPGIVFARGYIKSYALLLGMDQDDMVAQFDDMVGDEARSGYTVIRSGRRSRRKNQAALRLLIVIVVVLVGYLAYWAYNHFVVPGQGVASGARDTEFFAGAAAPDPGVVVSSGVIQRETPNQAGKVPVTGGSGRYSSAIQLVEGPLPAPDHRVEAKMVRERDGQRITDLFTLGADLLQVRFRGEGWIDISGADDVLIYRDLHKQGDVLRITGRAPFQLLLGDASAVSITLNQQDVPVAENIRIDNTARLLVGI